MWALALLMQLTQGQRKNLTRVGIEPTTFGLDHHCSTDLATRSGGSRPKHLQLLNNYVPCNPLSPRSDSYSLNTLSNARWFKLTMGTDSVMKGLRRAWLTCKSFESFPLDVLVWSQRSFHFLSNASCQKQLAFKIAAPICIFWGIVISIRCHQHKNRQRPQVPTCTTY